MQTLNENGLEFLDLRLKLKGCNTGNGKSLLQNPLIALHMLTLKSVTPLEI